MTASPINAPSALNAVAAPGAALGLFGAGQAATAQGPLAGFDALVAAFFGGQAQAEPGTPAAAKPGDATATVAAAALAQGKDAKTTQDTKDAQDAKTAAEGLDAPVLSTDAQILASLLAQPIAAPPSAEPTQAEPGQDATQQAAAAGGGFAPQLADQGALMAKAAKSADTAEARAAAGLEAGKAEQTAQADDAAAAETDAALAGKSALLPAATPDLAADAPRPAPHAAAPPQAAPQPAPHAPAAPPPAALAAAAPPPPAPIVVAEIPESAQAQVEAAEAPEAAAPLGEPAAAPAPSRNRAPGRTARNEAGRGETASAAAPSVDQAAQAASAHVDAASAFEAGGEHRSEDKAPALDAATAKDDPAQPNAQAIADPAATAAAPQAPAEIRAGPQTVAHLAAQIVKKLEGRSTQFDVALNPEGLGQVDVRIEIGAQGKLTASMSFENAQAANELRGRAGELQKALEQAGFDVSGGIRFDVAADRGQGQAGQGQFGQDAQNNGGAWRGRAFQQALDSADQTADAALSGALNLQRRTLSGVDVRI